MNRELHIALLKFSLGFFNKALSGNVNHMVSPLSVCLALTLLMNGAGDETAKVFLDVLGEGLSREDYNRELSEYLKELPSDKGASLQFANSLWADKDLRMKYKFSSTNRSLYRAASKRVEFNADTVGKMNRWVEKNTQGMISHIIDALNPLEKLVIINALAFKGDWEKPFEKDRVHEAEFTNADGSVSAVSGMYATENYYLQNDECTGFVKPYEGGRYAFAAFLPNEGTDIEAFEQDLTAEKFFRLISGAQERKVDIMMPKFTSEYEVTINRYLADLGLSEAFTGTADYSGISNYEVLIGDVLHKTFIEVDETGTRAAAVTAVLMKGMAMADPNPKVYLDRPFVYAIIDRKYGLPVFIGDIVSM